jgi:hypothetical protein
LLAGALKSVLSQAGLHVFDPPLVYTRTDSRKMNNFIENNDDQFANGQVSRDLRDKQQDLKSDLVDAVMNCWPGFNHQQE